MPFNLLILPLIGGYLFISDFKIKKLTTARLEGHRLLIESALAGIVFLVLSSVVTFCGARACPQIANAWYNVFPFKYSGTAFFSLILGYSLPKIMNPFITERYLLSKSKKIIEDRGEPLEVLLEKALSEQKQVALTLKNHKVYIGRITSLFNPATPLRFIKILPTWSGYRDPITKQMFLPVSYQKAYEKIITPKSEVDLGDFEMVISVSEILSANIFDMKTYVEHFKEENF
ncbi:MAG: hypothetical protein D6743_16075 [Calditrichaeota bacterium]|nr:MAG: hypothetical protein D6743_16075 [Calditrichota bacterium]